LSQYSDVGKAGANETPDRLIPGHHHGHHCIRDGHQREEGRSALCGVREAGRNNSFVYKKSFGYASLEFGVPLTPESVFYVASVSKQFTAASVVLAAEQGYLSLDDDVHKYLPELPDYGHSVTLRQMLHQTSGSATFLT
jgi:CubicO group peptidase (beta-lactamase class C family)